jgi:hypothetical protein
MKHATAYQRRGKTFLHADFKTTFGLWILGNPVLACDSCDVEQLGRSILETLDGSRDGVPHPTSWKGGFDPILHLSGAGSWGAFVKSTECVGIERHEDLVTLIPTRNEGSRGGFVPITEKTRESQLVPAELGKVLLAAFADCE